jgi:sugar lactone lactonase YvrE
MVIDSTRVYGTDFNAGNVYAAPIGWISDGGSPSVLASAQGSPFALATDGTNLYWTNYGGGGVVALSLAGGEPATIASGVSQPNQIAVTGGTVYFSSSAVDEIYAAPTTGITDGGPPSIFVAAGPTSTDSFVYDGTTVFWATSGNPGGEILSAPPGGAPTTLAVGLTSPGSLAFDATNIYWADFAYGTVFELAK